MTAHSVGCLLTHRVSFGKQVFNFNAEFISLFSFWLPLSGSCANNLCLPQMKKIFPYVFFWTLLFYQSHLEVQSAQHSLKVSG